MDDLLSLLKWPVVALLRALWWLSWELLVQTIGWSIGWVFLRALTFGRFPEERFRGLDDASWSKALFIEAVGLVLLALAIWALSGSWSHL